MRNREDGKASVKEFMNNDSWIIDGRTKKYQKRYENICDKYIAKVIICRNNRDVSAYLKFYNYFRDIKVTNSNLYENIKEILNY